MRKERYKLVGLLFFTVVMIILGLVGVVQDTDYEFLFFAVVWGLAPYGYCLLNNRKNNDYDEILTLSSCIIFLLKFFIGSLIGIIAFIPMLCILIKNVKEENKEFIERELNLNNRIDVSDRLIKEMRDRFENKYLPVLTKYPESLEVSKKIHTLHEVLHQLQKKLFHIQRYKGNIFYSGLISTFIMNVKLRRVFKQVEKSLSKIAVEVNVLASHDYLEEDDDCLCEWADELEFYEESICKDLDDAEWLIYKYQEMFGFFWKRDLILLIIGFLFIISL